MSNILVKKGEVLTINIETSGGKSGVNYKYQWFYNNSPITDQTTNELNITNVQLNNSGNYFCKVSQQINEDIKTQIDSKIYKVLVVDLPNFIDFKVHNNNNLHNYSFRGIVFGNGNNISYKAKIEYSSDSINWIDYNSFSVINSQREIYNFNLLINTITLIENKGYFRLVLKIDDYNEVKSNNINLFVNVIPVFSQTIVDNICYIYGETYNLGVTLEEGKGFAPFRYLWEFVADGRIIPINDTTTSNYNHTISLTINDTFFRWNQFIRCTIRDAGNYQFETFVLMPVVKIEKIVSNLNVLNVVNNSIDAYRVIYPMGYYDASHPSDEFLTINTEYRNGDEIILNDTSSNFRIINIFRTKMSNQNQYFDTKIVKANSWTNTYNLSLVNNFRPVIIYRKGFFPNEKLYTCTIPENYNIIYQLIDIRRNNIPKLYNVIVNREQTIFTPTDILGLVPGLSYRWFDSRYNKVVSNNLTIILNQLDNNDPGRYYLEISGFGKNFYFNYYFSRINFEYDILPPKDTNTEIAEYLCQSQTSYRKQFLSFFLRRSDYSEVPTNFEFNYTLQLFNGEDYEDIETITKISNDRTNPILIFNCFENPIEDLFSIEQNIYRIKITYTAFSGEWISRSFKIKIDPPVAINNALLPVSQRRFYYLFKTNSNQSYSLDLKGYYKFGSLPHRATWKVISSEEFSIIPTDPRRRKRTVISENNNIIDKSFMSSLLITEIPPNDHRYNGIYRAEITDNENNKFNIDTFTIMKIVYTSEITTNPSINRLRQYTIGTPSLTFKYNLEIYGGNLSQLRFQWQIFTNNTWIDIKQATQQSYTINSPNTNYTLRLIITVPNFINRNTIYTDSIFIKSNPPIVYNGQTYKKLFEKNTSNTNIILSLVRSTINGGLNINRFNWLNNNIIIENKTNLFLETNINSTIDNIISLRVYDSTEHYVDFVISEYKCVDIQLTNNFNENYIRIGDLIQTISNNAFNTKTVGNILFIKNGLTNFNHKIFIELYTNNLRRIISKEIFPTNNLILTEEESIFLFNTCVSTNNNVFWYFGIEVPNFERVIIPFKYLSLIDGNKYIYSVPYKPINVFYVNCKNKIFSSNFLEKNISLEILKSKIKFNDNQYEITSNRNFQYPGKVYSLFYLNIDPDLWYDSYEKSLFRLENDFVYNNSIIGNFSFLVTNVNKIKFFIFRNDEVIINGSHSVEDFNNGVFLKVNDKYNKFNIKARYDYDPENSEFKYVNFYISPIIPLTSRYFLKNQQFDLFFGTYLIKVYSDNNLISEHSWIHENIDLPNIILPETAIESSNYYNSFMIKDIEFGPFPLFDEMVLQLCLIKETDKNEMLDKKQVLISRINLNSEGKFKIPMEILESISEFNYNIGIFFYGYSESSTVISISPIINYYRIRSIQFWRKIFYKVSYSELWKSSIQTNEIVSPFEKTLQFFNNQTEKFYTLNSTNKLILKSFNEVLLPKERNRDNNKLIIQPYHFYLLGISNNYPPEFDIVNIKLLFKNIVIYNVENFKLPSLNIRRDLFSTVFSIDLNNLRNKEYLELEISFSSPLLQPIRYRLLEINHWKIISPLNEIIVDSNFDSVEINNDEQYPDTIAINLYFTENNERQFRIGDFLKIRDTDTTVTEFPIEYQFCYGFRRTWICKEPCTILSKTFSDQVCMNYGITERENKGPGGLPSLVNPKSSPFECLIVDPNQGTAYFKMSQSMITTAMKKWNNSKVEKDFGTFQEKVNPLVVSKIPLMVEDEYMRYFTKPDITINRFYGYSVFKSEIPLKKITFTKVWNVGVFSAKAFIDINTRKFRSEKWYTMPSRFWSEEVVIEENYQALSDIFTFEDRICRFEFNTIVWKKADPIERLSRPFWWSHEFERTEPWDVAAMMINIVEQLNALYWGYSGFWVPGYLLPNLFCASQWFNYTAGWHSFNLNNLKDTSLYFDPIKASYSKNDTNYIDLDKAYLRFKINDDLYLNVYILTKTNEMD